MNKETYNWKSLFVAICIILLGLIMCFISAFVITSPWDNIMISIGCSLIASGLVILLHDFIIDRKTTSMLDDWKIEKIFSTRAEKNAESDPELTKARYCVDAIAFGLSSFRSKHRSKVEQCLRQGVNFRIITMDPDSSYTNARDLEEHKNNGTTSHSIRELILWADQLNSKKFKGKIVVRGYSTMTLDFYWRVDDYLYVGPYWYGVESQQTITYKFLEGGKGFTQYSDYFEELWNNDGLCKTLTKAVEMTPYKHKRK